MGFKLEIKGLDVTVKKFDRLAKTAKADANLALTNFAKNVTNDAKAKLQRGEGGKPTSNTGQLAKSINWKNSKQLEVTVTATAVYAAYVEFGTKKYAAQYVAGLPADWQAYAATFKGKGSGTFDQLIEALLQWMKDRQIKPLKIKGQTKKQTLEADAYALALHIVRHGTKAQPYLYPAVVKNEKQLRDDLKEIFK